MTSEFTATVSTQPSAAPQESSHASPLPSWLNWSGSLLELGYSFGQKLHRSISHPQFAPISTICVGNLTAGGTGKTPAVKYLARVLSQRGRKPAVLMRGYKGQRADEAAEMRAALEPLKAPLIIG